MGFNTTGAGSEGKEYSAEELLEWKVKTINELRRLGLTFPEAMEKMNAVSSRKFGVVAFANANTLKKFFYRWAESGNGAAAASQEEKKAAEGNFGADSSLDMMNNLFPDDLPEVFEKEDGTKFYVFQVKQEELATGQEYTVPVSIPVKLVDEIVFDYVRHGRNASQQALCDKYGITGKTWNMLKSRLNLTKLSNAVSDETLRDADAAGTLNETVADVSEKHFQLKVKDTFRTQHEKTRERHIKKAFLRLGSRDALLAEIQEVIAGHKPLAINPKEFEFVRSTVKKSVSVFLSDVHLGRKNSDEILANLKKIQTEIIALPEQEVNLIILGDIVEALTQDGFHPGQVAYGLDMENFGVGYKGMMKIVDILEAWILHLAKKKKIVKVWGVSGNHGRMTKIKEEDHERIGELVIYELIKRGLQNVKNVEVTVCNDVITELDIGNIRYIIGHGDGRVFDQQNPANIILKHGNNQKFNVIVSGDKHNFKMQDVENMGVYIKTRALAGIGHYEKQNDFIGSNGYLVMRENDERKVDIIVRTF